MLLRGLLPPVADPDPVLPAGQFTQPRTDSHGVLCGGGSGGSGGAVTAADNAIATLGAKADNKSAATDTTSTSLMAVLKELSYLLQHPLAICDTNCNPIQNSDIIGITIPVTCPAGYTHFQQDSGAITGATTTSLLSAAGSSTNYYILSAQAVNMGASDSLITIVDGASAVLARTIAPHASGSNIALPGAAITSTTNTTVSVTTGTASTSIYVDIQGCKGP